MTWASGPDSGCLGAAGGHLVAGGPHILALDWAAWTLRFLAPGRREQCLVLSSNTSPLGDAVFFMSGALYNLTSGAWSFLPPPPVSFNLASVRGRGGWSGGRLAYSGGAGHQAGGGAGGGHRGGAAGCGDPGVAPGATPSTPSPSTRWGASPRPGWPTPRPSSCRPQSARPGGPPQAGWGSWMVAQGRPY